MTDALPQRRSTDSGTNSHRVHDTSGISTPLKPCLRQEKEDHQEVDPDQDGGEPFLPLPPNVLDQEPAHKRPERAPPRDGKHVDPDLLTPLMQKVEIIDDSRANRLTSSAPEGSQDRRGQQAGEAPGQRTPYARGEDDDAGDEKGRPLPEVGCGGDPEEVGEAEREDEP